MTLMNSVTTIQLITLLTLPVISAFTHGKPTFDSRHHGKRIGVNVTLDYGTFTGVFNDSIGILNFRGIKYADAPTGDLRFKAPVSPPKQNLGVVNATSFAPACIQAGQSDVVEGYSEDCLYANIYVPKGTRRSSKLPVVIYFHGGGFQSGQISTFPPELLLNSAEEPFIYTVFAYRLGAFGFLGGSQIASDGNGNAGLLDQRAAMRWVKRYISKFGGDPDAVTIWGQSAGAGSTMFHLVANGGDNEDLFQRAIGDSPSHNYAPEMDSDYAEGLFEQYAGFANCTGDTALQCLRAANISTLAYASSKTLESRPTNLFPFAPITDGSFIQEQPSKAFKAGRFAKVSTLFGSNTDEGVGWWEDMPSSTDVSSMDSTNDTVYNFISGQFPTLSKETFAQILGQYPLDLWNGQLTSLTAQIYAEMRYICTAKMINGAVHDAGLTSYGYHYDNPDSEGYTRHAAELAAYYTLVQPWPGSAGLFPAMRRYLTSFIVDGEPKISDDRDSGNVWGLWEGASGAVWRSVSGKDGSPRIYLHPFNVSIENDEALNQRCDFWRSIDDELVR